MTENTFQITDSSDATVTMIRATVTGARKLARNYATLVEMTGLTPESTSGAITAAAHGLIMLAYPKTTPGDMRGRDNGTQVWRDARAMRAGLVKAIKAMTPETETPETETPETGAETGAGAETETETGAPVDYVAAVITQADWARQNGVDAAAILDAITTWAAATLA